jgi:hypothetical protein
VKGVGTYSPPALGSSNDTVAIEGIDHRAVQRERLEASSSSQPACLHGHHRSSTAQAVRLVERHGAILVIFGLDIEPQKQEAEAGVRAEEGCHRAVIPAT